MIDIKMIKENIVQKLQPFYPKEIILFGSYAYGTPTQDSDIDLYIVTDDDFLPNNFQENMDVKMKYIKAIYEITADIPADIIVHTKKMNEKFRELNSYFSRKIYSEGEILYAKH